MDGIAREYYQNLLSIQSSVSAADGDGKAVGFFEGVKVACNLILTQDEAGKKLLFIGNGGSAAISSHMAVDFFKRGGVTALSFNDGALLTCMGNDYGYDHVFEKPLSRYSSEGDILVAISSSGKSENILLGVRAARENGAHVITLSGFGEDNPLFAMGALNFHVPSMSYGIVEVFHHSICHCILDTLITARGPAGV